MKLLTFKNREELIVEADKLIAHNGGIKDYMPYMHLYHNCGCVRVYFTKDGVPHSSDKCSHGNYFVYYTDQENDNFGCRPPRKVLESMNNTDGVAEKRKCTPPRYFFNI